MKKGILHFLILVTILLCVVGTASANLIVNGSFEDDSRHTSLFWTLTAGTSSADDIPGWIVSSGSIDWIDDYWQASDRDKSLDLAGSYAQGTIVGQSFATTPGQKYIVSFDIAGNPDRSYDKYAIAAVIGGTQHNFMFDQAMQTKSNMGWTSVFFDFIATGSMTQLSFKDATQGSNNAWGAALDNIIVEAAPVPEPGTLLLLGSGLAGLGFFARHRKK